MKLSLILGTRPEVIKLAPVIHEARRKGHAVKIIFTGQHRELIAPLLRFFQITPTVDLGVMEPGQSLTGLSTKVFTGLEKIPRNEMGDLLLVQGDTTSAFLGAFWGFCQKIPVGHIEAGLRTYDLKSPFPEEANRQLISRIAALHFAPTLQSAQALEREGIPSDAVFLAGNTGIDALHYVLNQLDQNPSLETDWIPKAIWKLISEQPGRPEIKLVLVTAHRRESFGTAFERICHGVKKIADHHPNARIVFPVHPNPQVRVPVQTILSNHPHIFLCEPLDYLTFVALMRRAHLLLTDSGGIQEEGPSLGKPILVMRSTTERPEGIQAGFSKLVGTDPELIFCETTQILKTDKFVAGKNPYGDGKSSEKIIQFIEKKIFSSLKQPAFLF